MERTGKSGMGRFNVELWSPTMATWHWLSVDCCALIKSADKRSQGSSIPGPRG
jgi:hypothetical protein